MTGSGEKGRAKVAVLVVLALVVVGVWVGVRRQGGAANDGVIEMTAANFKFTPRDIVVKAGDTVKIRVRSVDDDHGIAFKVIAIGQPEGSAPGLRFQTTTPDWILKKGDSVLIEFVAERAGAYEFACSVFCGMGHNGMLGRIIVEPR